MRHDDVEEKTLAQQLVIYHTAFLRHLDISLCSSFLQMFKSFILAISWKVSVRQCLLCTVLVGEILVLLWSLLLIANYVTAEAKSDLLKDELVVQIWSDGVGLNRGKQQGRAGRGLEAPKRTLETDKDQGVAAKSGRQETMDLKHW